MRRFVTAASILIGFLLSTTLYAQVGGGPSGGPGGPGGPGGGKKGNKKKDSRPKSMIILRLYETAISAEKLQKALEKMGEVVTAQVDVGGRQVTVEWRGDPTEAVKMEATCRAARVPAMVLNPLRISVRASGRGTAERLANSVQLVGGVKKVEPASGGVVVWADPVVDLEKVQEAAERVKFTVKFLTHEQRTYVYEPGDDADLDAYLSALDMTWGVIRVTRDDAAGNFTVFSSKKLSRSVIGKLGRKHGLKVKEQKKEER